MLSQWRHLRSAHPWIIDILLALAPVLSAFPGVIVSVDGTPVPTPHWPGYLITGIACATLAGVRSFPRPVAAATVGCTIALASLGYPLTPLLLAPTIALGFVALHTAGRAAFTFTAAVTAVMLCTAVIARRPGSPLALELIGTGAWLLLAAALGRVARIRHAYTEAVHARAEYAERTREEEALRRVAGERMRIARELHDVVAHHLALANAQAGTVAYLMDNNPVKARAIVGDLNRTIVSALEDLGTTVGLLRQAGEADSPLEPAPGLGRLPELAASFHATGLEVTITVDGATQPLPPGTDLAAYRIIQEALTNVTKHSAAEEAHVRLAYAHDRLGVTVNDSGGAPPARAESAPGSGYGLIGMRERAISLGGQLHAGPLATGGFEVAAELPLHPHRPGEDSHR